MLRLHYSSSSFVKKRHKRGKISIESSKEIHTFICQSAKLAASDRDHSANRFAKYFLSAPAKRQVRFLVSHSQMQKSSAIRSQVEQASTHL
jgi:hypothetical protein